MQNKNTILSGNTSSFFKEENFEKENQLKTLKQKLYSKHVLNVNKAENQQEKNSMIKFNQNLRNTVLSCSESELTSIEITIMKMKE